MIDELKKNIDVEIEILREISNYNRAMEYAGDVESSLLKGAIKSLRQVLVIINDSIPVILQEKPLIPSIPQLPSLPKSVKKDEPKGGRLEKVEYRGIKKLELALNKKDKDRFLKELKISEEFVKKIRKKRIQKGEKIIEFKASRGYLKLSNRLFLGQAVKWIKKGYFTSLSVELRKANLDMLLEAYVAMIFLNFAISAVFSILLFVFLMFVDVSVVFPFFSVYDGEYFARIGKIFWIPIILPLLTFAGSYYYPSTEKRSISAKIDQELPFAVIHMSAISGSGIAPSEVFKIISVGREYPSLRKEFRKIINQINLFGYDLITSLNNSAKIAPSEKLSELYSGLSTSVTSGASLKEFFEKRSETLLLSYRLEREKYTRLVETFLDIYISIVIAAPMIFMLLIIMIFISGIEIQLSSIQITLLFVGGVALLNVVFLLFLQTKQPAY